MSILGQLMSYEPTGALGFGRFLLLQKIWPINGLVNARWLGPWRLRLGAMTSWILVMKSWTKQERHRRRSRQVPRQNVRWRGRIVIFELTFTIERPKLQRRSWGWPQSIKGLPFSFLQYTHMTHNPLLFCYYTPFFCYTYYARDNPI
jgi:hypothetical protein